MTDLPSSWERVRLDELCTINPRSFDEPINDDDDLSLVPMALVEAETGRIDPSQVVRYGDVRRKSLTPFQERDVLFAKVTPCMENGKIAIVEGVEGGRGLGSTELYVLRPIGAIDSKYLMYYLLQSSVRRDAERKMTGAVGLRRVPRSYIESLEVPVAPLAEQKRVIASIEGYLSSLETGVAQLRKTLLRIDGMRERIMAAACTGHFDVATDGPPPPEPPAAGVADGELPQLPSLWRWARLGDLAEVVGGVTKDSKRQSDPSVPLVPYLRVANVQRGRLDLSRIAYIRVSAEKAEQLRLQHGDVLLNEGGDRDKLGRGWIWEGQVDRCIHQNHVFRARIHRDVLHPKLLAWHANGFGRKWFEANGKQSVNLASISLSKIKMFPVPVPPVALQEYLVSAAEARLSVLDRSEALIREALAWSASLRWSLLTEAFRGRLLPQDPTDEPAFQLLARMKMGRVVQSKPKRVRRTTPKESSNTTRVEWPRASRTPVNYEQEELL